MSENATIRIEIGGVKLTVGADVEQEQLGHVLATIRNELPELFRSAGETAASPSLASLLATSHARTFGDKAGVVAYWLEHHQGRHEWRSGDIVDALEQAGETPPVNITDALNQKLKKGLFEVHDRRWKLTGEGRGWVKWHLLDSRDE